MTDSSFIVSLESNPIFSNSTLQVVESQFDLDRYYDELFNVYQIDLPDTIVRAVNKRKAEFLAGRICARKALEKISNDSNAFNIGIGSNREPLFTSKFYGTITHSEDWAMAAVTSSDNGFGIGIDRETILTSSIAKVMLKQVLNSKEAQWVSRQDSDFNWLVTLCYSAKESFYKAAFNQVRRFFDFDSVEIISVDEQSQTYELNTKEALAENLPKGRTVSGKYCQFNQDIVTFIQL